MSHQKTLLLSNNILKIYSQTWQHFNHIVPMVKSVMLYVFKLLLRQPKRKIKMKRRKLLITKRKNMIKKNDTETTPTPTTPPAIHTN